MSKTIFQLHSKFVPAGDQPQAISALLKGLESGKRFQTLLGVTGSGKTYTAANVIEHIGKPVLVIAHNKTLAAQLAQEYRDFFPQNAVHYFVSYYDYYQPEAYLPTSDTYIEKEAQINKEIERLRHASTQSLLTRKDTIIIASVSCIYGLGNPEEYVKVNFLVKKGDKAERSEFIRRLVGIYFNRTTADLTPGLFRVLGRTLEIMPVSEEGIHRITFGDGTIEKIERMHPMTRELQGEENSLLIFPAKHFVTPADERLRALHDIRTEFQERLKVLEGQGKLLEADRLKRRTTQDLALIEEVGYCNGIENYSRHFDGRKPGEPPHSLLSYFPKTKEGSPDFLTLIDESHVTLPQIGGMYEGDRSRKETLIEHGFRLPSAKDNRPLRFNEFLERVGPIIFTSATPGKFEKERSEQIVEQIIRPTGLLDPILEMKKVTASPTYPGQVRDFIEEAEKAIEKGGRVIGTTLTKKMAEDLSLFLKERHIKAEYLHSDIETIERITILTEFRKGKFDCLIGVNLLREGLDLPEVSLIGIFDADREGFLRSETSLIQIIGRAARNSLGRVILYADASTGSMERAIGETTRRRAVQESYNREHGITPTTVVKQVRDITELLEGYSRKAAEEILFIEEGVYGKGAKELRKLMKIKEKEMREAVKELDFETAAILRDEMAKITLQLFGSQKKKRRKEDKEGRVIHKRESGRNRAK